MDDYTEKRDELLAIAEEAKKRVIFYYKNLSESKKFSKEDVLTRTINILNNLTFGFDYSVENGYIAYYDGDNNIYVNKAIWNFSKEEQIAVLIHEINHGISDNNKNNKGVTKNYSDAEYVHSYKIIEEGLADATAELIMNFYYDNSGIDIPNKCSHFKDFACGYTFNRSVLKTFLSILQITNNDKNMLLNYYYGDRHLFFEKIKDILGMEFFEFLKKHDSENNFGLAFKFFEEKFNSEMDKNDFSSKGYYAPNFENVYYQENNILKSLRVSYFIQNILKKYDINNIDADMIDQIYNDTNGLIEDTTKSFTPQIIDKLICNWINNSNEENFEKIYKLIPKINMLSNNKYLILRLKKIFGKDLNLKNFNAEELDKIIEFLNKNIGYNTQEYNDNNEEIKEGILINYSKDSEMCNLLLNLYVLSSDTQKENLKLFSTMSIEKNTIEEYINNEFEKVFGNKIENIVVTKDVLHKLINNYRGYIDLIIKTHTTELLERVIESWIENCDFKDLYLICNLIPGVFSMDNGKYMEYAYYLGKLNEDDRQAFEDELFNQETNKHTI